MLSSSRGADLLPNSFSRAVPAGREGGRVVSLVRCRAVVSRLSQHVVGRLLVFLGATQRCDVGLSRLVPWVQCVHRA